MVLSEPFGRIEPRTPYGNVPPRKRPALGRRYRPEQNFSSGLRRRDERRTGTPDPCSAALYGRVLKAAPNTRAYTSRCFDESRRQLCQNCVTCSPKARVNIAICGDALRYVVAPESR